MTETKRPDEHIAQLEVKIKGLKDLGKKYSDDSQALYERLIKDIRNKGYTRPAEFRLLNGMLEQIELQLNALKAVNIAISEGSTLIVKSAAQ
jgi:hypothetical protein